MLLIRRLFDLSEAVSKGYYPRFTHFLNEREQYAVQQTFAKLDGCRGALSGGFDGAQRQMAGIFPEDWSDSLEAFPITAVTVVHGREETLSHRDVLGSLIGLGLARESIGDILPEQGECRIVVEETVAPLLVEELRKVGRTGVSCRIEDISQLRNVQRYEPVTGTVSSTRLDCLVSLITRLAREKSAALIKSQLVQVNYRVEDSVSTSFGEGDIITVRGYGKYIVDTLEGPTKKGRLRVSGRKYA